MPHSPSVAAHSLKPRRYHRNSYRNGKSNRQTGHVDCGDKEEVCKVENRPASKRVNEIRSIRRADVVQKTRSIIRSIAHRKRQCDSDRENAEGVVSKTIRNGSSSRIYKCS